MKNSIIVDSEKISIFDAMVWAGYQFGTSSFTFENSFPDRYWKFTFKTAKQATYFALKWG